MTLGHSPIDRLAEVARLSTLLSERVLDAVIMKRRVVPKEAVALAQAARLLQDHGVEWPPLLTQVIHELARQEEQKAAPETSPTKALADIVSGGLSRLLSKPRSRSNDA